MRHVLLLLILVAAGCSRPGAAPQPPAAPPVDPAVKAKEDAERKAKARELGTEAMRATAKLHDYSRAISLANQSISLDPSCARALLARGEASSRLAHDAYQASHAAAAAIADKQARLDAMLAARSRYLASLDGVLRDLRRASELDQGVRNLAEESIAGVEQNQIIMRGKP